MAEETKKLKFNGREVDSSLIDLADKYVSQYMDFKNMNQALLEEFLNEYRDATRRMLGGEDWSGNTDNPNILHTGAFTGLKKDDSRSWYGLPRERTNITDSVYEYLTGMAGKVNLIKSLTATSNSNAATSKWVRHTNGSKNSTLLHLIDNLIGNGGAEAWADLLNDRIGDNGERPIVGRLGLLRNTLSNYASDLEGGKYGNLDDDRNLELSLVRAIIEDKGEDPTRTLALYKQLLSDDLYNRLFFTGEKYLNSAQTQLLEQEKKDKAQEATNEAYVRGESPDNPYNPNGTKEERDKYLGLELRKADYNLYMIEEDFKKLPGVYSDYVAPSTTFTTQLYNLHEHPELYQNIDNDELMRYILRAKDLSTDYLGYDIRDAYNGELGHADFSGHGEGDENESLEYLKDYFDAIGETPDDSRNGLGPLFTKAKSNSAILGQYALSMYYNKMASEGKLLDYSIGNGEYVIPETSDWNNGSVYTMKIKNGQAKLMARNIGQLINDLMKLPGSPLLNLMLTTYEKYRRSAQTAADGAKLVLKYAGGGISAAESSYFNTPVTPAGWVSLHNVTPQEGAVASDDAQIYYNLGIDRGTREQIRFEEGQRSPTSDEFTPTEMARIGAAAADLTGAIAAWLPGYGTATSATLGIGSTLANLGADWSDESVTAGQMAKNLGLNLAFDVVGLFPGLGMAGKGAKVINGIARYLPKIITAGAAIGLAPDMLNSIQRAFKPGEKLSVLDWKNVAYGLSAIAGVSRMGASAYKSRAYKNLRTQTNYEYKNKAGEVVKPTTEQINKIKGAKTEAEYKLAYKEVFGEEPTTGFNKGSDGWIGKVTGRFRNNKIPSKSEVVEPVNEELFQNALRQEAALQQRHPRMSKYFNSDFDIFARQSSVFRRPYRFLSTLREDIPKNEGTPKTETAPKTESASKKETTKNEPVSRVVGALNSKMSQVIGALKGKDETAPLYGAMLRALSKNKLDKIKDKKEFVRFLREAFKNKTVAKQKEIIDNMSAKNLLNLRRKWAFKQGGVIPVFKIGNTFRGIIGSSDNALTGLEIGKALYSNYMSDKAARKIKSAPVYLETTGTPINAFVSTNNLQNQFDNIANLTRSTANNLGKLYSTSELQLASRLAGEKQAANYGIEAVKAINDLYNKGMENVLNANNYNIRVQNEVLNRNNKYKISKAESNNSVDAENIRWKGSTLEKLGKVALYGIRAAGQARWNSARNSALNNTARYKELFNTYNLAKANYNLGITNKLDETLLKPLQEAFASAERALQSYTNEFNSRYIAANPRPLGTPFAVSTPSYVYPGDFFSNIPEYKEGGGIGKMTLAELVKLFRDKERQKYKDRESYRKYLDKYSERVSRANKAIAYQAYIKMLNK